MRSQDNDFELMGSILSNFIEEQKMAGLAQHFSDVAHVFVQCLDAESNPLTEMIGNEKEKDRILELIDNNQLQEILDRLTESNLEDQVVENTAYPNLKLAVVSTKIGKQTVANWVVIGVLNDVGFDEDFINSPLEDFEYNLSEQQFYSVVDALRNFTSRLFENELNNVSLTAENKRSRSSEEEMGVNLRRAEALTEIVQLLETDDSIERIMVRMLEIIGRFLYIDSSIICRFKRGTDDVVEKLASYTPNPEINKDSAEIVIPAEMLKKAHSPLIMSSSGSMSAYERGFMEDMNVKAIIIMPIHINQIPGMYACFIQTSNDRVWSIGEIKFINDSVKILQSIMTKRVQKNSIASSYESIETILDNVGSAVYVRELNSQKPLFANSIMQRTFKTELKEGTINTLLDNAINGESGASEIYVSKQNKYYDLYYTRIRWVDGSPVLLCALYDISQKKVYQKKIEQQAFTDFLTGLYNRMCCEKDLAAIIDESEKTGKAGALLYLDLDDFKHINDSLGHQYGDVLLRSISHALSSIEGIEDSCYRMGGDEFVIIIPPSQYDRVNTIVAAIKDVFAKPWYLKDSDYYCTMSMGLVVYPEFGNGVHDLIKKADIAMYEAKKSGKNRMAYYSDGIDSASGKRLDMEKNMRDATNSGFKEFEVYYQPVVDTTKPGYPCCGCEALIRWNSAELGFISPGEFIPLAEYLGLINPIGNYVLFDAAAACRKWNDNGYPNHRVNVNLSVVQLLQNDVVQIIEDTIKETGINPHNLTLEVTESLAINDMERMKKILAKIKELGVNIALDDFGTGYSSLNHIREIPFDIIKVDQSFIRNLESDSYAGSFVKMIGELAEAIGVKVCVEGVETKAQLDILKDMPIDLIQGFFFDKPMRINEFEKKYMPNLYV